MPSQTQGLISVPGRKPLLELLRHRPGQIREVLVSDSLQSSAEFSRALAKLSELGVSVQSCTKDLLEGLVPHINHQGVVSRVLPREPVPPDQLIELAKRDGTFGVLLVVDEITDPHNIGALFRVADASGVIGIVLTKAHTAAITDTVRKVSAGSTEFVPFAFVANLQRFLEMAKAAGLWIVGAALGEESTNVYTTELPGPLALVVGSEGQGLRRLTKDMCDILIEIPMNGAVESLNVSHAAAVVLYELERRRQAKA